MTAPQPGEIEVEDQLERRIRKPVDLLRCVCPASGSSRWRWPRRGQRHHVRRETDLVGASHRLPHALVVVASPVALFALLILPVAMAVQLLVRRQFRRLGEAVATGVLAAAVTAVVNDLLTRPAASRLYYAIIMARPGTSHAAALDPYLAGLVAYATMVGLAAWPYWRNALWAAIAVYAVVQRGGVAHLRPDPADHGARGPRDRPGRQVRRGLRVAAAQRPGHRRRAGRRRPAGDRDPAGPPSRHRQGNPSRHYAVTARGDGCRLDVVVYDRDQQAAGAIYRLYRRVRVLGQVSRSAPLSMDRAVGRRALLSYAAEDAGAPTPRLRALVRVGPEASVLAYEHHEGTTLAQRDTGCSDAELSQIWEAVGRLHAHKVTHRRLTADRILLTGDGQAMLLDPGDGDVAASDLQIRLDVAQLLAELALAVGPDRAAGLAVEKIERGRPGGGGVGAAAGRAGPPHPQSAAPPPRRAARAAHPAAGGGAGRRGHPGPAGTHPAAHPADAGRRRRRRLPAGRRAGAGQPQQRAAGGRLALDHRRAGPVGGHLRRRRDGADRVRRRAAELPPHPARPAGRLLRHAGDPRRRRRGRAEHQVPAAPEDPRGGRGGQRRRGPGGGVRPAHPADPRVRRDRRQRGQRTDPAAAAWAWFVLAGLVLIALVVLAIPPGRRLLRARLSPMLGQVLPRLLEVAQQPRKLAHGIGGALLLSLLLHLLPRRLRGGVQPVGADREIGLVYLTGSAIGAVVPTPGGMGAVEAALTAGLTAAGCRGAVAVSAVLLFRLLTFWLPVPFGWGALKYLEREQAL